MSLAGKDFLIQVNGTSGAWNEVSVAFDASPSLDPDLLEVTPFGKEAPERIQGLVDAGMDLEVYTQESAPTAISDLEDSALNGTDVDVEFQPDGNGNGNASVYAFTGLVASYDWSASADSDQTKSITIENSDGNKVTTSGSLSS